MNNDKNNDSMPDSEEPKNDEAVSSEINRPSVIDDPLIIESEGFSFIWLVPLVALLIGGWMAYQQYEDKPIMITIHFPDGDGINVGKTEVRYKGLSAGVVSDLALDDDGNSVQVSLEMDNRFDTYLSTETQFWLVRPEISVSGIKGLETLVSGNYIGVRPIKGEKTREFVALDGPPPPNENEPGLHIRLTANDLGSLSVGSPVTYKKINVGSVQDYQLQGDRVVVDVFIKPKYSHLVKSGSHFWNSSGVYASGGLSGFEIKTDSLASIVAGGIAFHNPRNGEKTAATNNDEYHLYDDYKRASAGVTATIMFESAKGLVAENTELRYNGFKVGSIRRVDYVESGGGALITVVVDPDFDFLLVSDSKFWLVKPELSLSGISGLETIISGNYIEVIAGKGTPKYAFTALKQAPKMDYSVPGLHIKIVSDSLPSISHGSPILYRKVQVGEVQSYTLLKGGKQIEIQVHIKQQYAHLLKKSSRFWNASGVRVKGGLGGIDIQTETLTTLLKGGLSFYTPNGKSKTAKNGHSYRLFDGIDEAKEDGIPITFNVSSGDGLNESTELRFQGINVGRVKKVQLSADMKRVIVKAVLNPDARALAVKGSYFWVVKPKLGLAQTANLDTLISGQYITVKPGANDDASQYEFELLDKAPTQKQEDTGLNIVLLSAFTQSIKSGITVFYRQVPVGTVTGVELANNADHVRIYINIEEMYRPLVRENTKFWNTSGIDINFKLFGGASLRTDSFESILEGGIGFATPNKKEMGKPALQQSRFTLHSEVKDKWLSWSPKIPLNR
ncbi:MAG: MCE family protein [Pseudomonadales bacterium]|nr:MCE family protein [Pseudomonadales bacterium]